MIRRVPGVPRITYDWGNGFVERSGQYAGRQYVSFSFEVELNRYAGECCGALSVGAEKSDADQEVFERFNSYLLSLLPQCSRLADWSRLLLSAEGRALQKEVTETTSFRQQFVETATYVREKWDEPPFDLAPDSVLCRGLLWSLDGMDISPLDCKEYIDGVLKREMQKFEYMKRAGQDAPAPRQRLTEEVRSEVWRRDSGQCARCGSREQLEFDHIVPVSLGGSSTVRNIELLCEACNRAKSNAI